MANPNPKLVKYFTLDGGRRQVSALVDSGTQSTLKRFILELDGKLYDDWFQLPSASAVDQVIAKTKKDLGGVVYDLPLNMGNQGPTFNPFLVAYFSPDGNRMQLSALIDFVTRVELEIFIHDLDGTAYDDWYQLPSASDVDQVMKKTVNDLSGLVYDLRFRN
ncbi:hypothetical protein ACW9HR_19155 [Nocardia gipuzkoensis]|uniref:hypothetical protein n=1 Tax=Nocardia TaxID=1817 RepID=UPI0013581205|nr:MULTISPECIES: hypothetical protein [Nocardia]